MKEMHLSERPSRNRELLGNVSEYYFNIILNPPFSPHPQVVRHIRVTTYVDKVLDGWAILASSREEVGIDSWSGGRQYGPKLETAQFGSEAISDLARVDRRVYDRAREELEGFQRQGHQFEIRDNTKYAAETAVAQP
ncbi:MAG: hypothetical protein KKB21_04920 [Nanoarchaeota archaeon]|nr:hypothetical protein [Nanoarchaeota archaeon]MBU4086888.1 hypothetical protein [Nanoarchaeota archaeon]